MISRRTSTKSHNRRRLVLVLSLVLGIVVAVVLFKTFGQTGGHKNGGTDFPKTDALDAKAIDCIDKITQSAKDANTYINKLCDAYAKQNLTGDAYQPKSPDDDYSKPTTEDNVPKESGHSNIAPYTGALYSIEGSTAGRANSAWVDSVIFDVYKAYLYAGILPSMALAQGWVESACFSSEGALSCHNYFGIKWKGTATKPKAQDLNTPYPTKPNGESVCVKQLWANAYFAYFNTPLEGFIMYGADPEHYYGYTNSNAYHTMRGAMLTGNYNECLNGSGKSDLMTWVGTGNKDYPESIQKMLEKNKLYLFDDEAYMVAYLKSHGLYDGESGIVIQGNTFYPGAGNYTYCSRNHVSGDLSSISFGGGMTAGEGNIPIAKMGSY